MRLGPTALLCSLTACGGGQRCAGGSVSDQSLTEAAEEISFGEIVGLGPHRMQAVVTRSSVRDGERRMLSEEQLQLVWQDWNNFQLRRLQNDRIAVDHLVSDGAAWVENERGELEQRGDPEPLRMEMRVAWDVWGQNTSPFQRHLRLDYVGEGVLEGRVARQYSLGLEPPDPRERPRLVPVSLSGKLWLDEESAVRLMAEVQGSWSHRGREQLVHEISIILVRSDFGTAELDRSP